PGGCGCGRNLLCGGSPHWRLFPGNAMEATGGLLRERLPASLQPVLRTFRLWTPGRVGPNGGRRSDNPPGMENGARGGIVELLGRVPLFSELSPEELDRIAQVAIPRSFPADTRVFHEGDPGDACYIVNSGSCRVTRQHSDGRVITLATLGPGAIFG